MAGAATAEVLDPDSDEATPRGRNVTGVVIPMKDALFLDPTTGRGDINVGIENDVFAALAQLANAGIPLYLLSEIVPDIAMALLRKYEAARIFTAAFGGTEPEAQVQGIRSAVQRHGGLSGELICVCPTQRTVDAARAVGCRMIGILGAAAPLVWRSGSFADFPVISSLADLTPSILGSEG